MPPYVDSSSSSNTFTSIKLSVVLDMIGLVCVR